jgi:YebC/PmpR family DNA-binding regulatory protein
MAGHSKWANIKHKKEAQDAKRSNAFAKMSRLITTAVQEGGGIGDPDKNVRLRLAVDRARAVNMPKDTIQRAIDKATGAGATTMKELVYEAFGPGGSALMITAITDNSNRTISEVKSLLDKNGGKMANQNAVSHLFTQCGVLELDKKQVSEEQAFDVFDQLNGIDVEDTPEAYILYIPFENIGKSRTVLADVTGSESPKSLDVYYLPKSPIVVDSSVMEKVERLVELLENHDDVQAVSANVDI